MLPFNFGSEVFNMGDVLSINCVVLKGDLPLDIQWSLNDEIIETGQDGFTILQLNSRTSYLSVDTLEAKHRGVYSCIAQNQAGKAKFAAELKVNGWWIERLFRPSSYWYCSYLSLTLLWFIRCCRAIHSRVCAV